MDFRALAHLAEQLGNERFQALISSNNTGKVKAFCDGLLKDVIPITVTLGERTYEILGFLRGDEEFVKGDVLVKRAKEVNAYLGKEDGEHVLAHQSEIPAELRGEIVFAFPDWRSPGRPGGVACVFWDGGRWVRGWNWLGDGWSGRDRLLRRK